MLKAARKQIDKYTPKREEIALKVPSVQEKVDTPRGSRSQKEFEKEQEKLGEKIASLRKELDKVEGKLEVAEFDVGRYKSRVEEHERLCRQKRAAQRILEAQKQGKIHTMGL
jgi:chromosome segregation ATPase